eukprot:scaffold2608_cov245-Pinguiococcus_pyrenoidosus.AAC.2
MSRTARSAKSAVPCRAPKCEGGASSRKLVSANEEGLNSRGNPAFLMWEMRSNQPQTSRLCQIEGTCLPLRVPRADSGFGEGRLGVLLHQKIRKAPNGRRKAGFQ